MNRCKLEVTFDPFRGTVTDENGELVGNVQAANIEILPETGQVELIFEGVSYPLYGTVTNHYKTRIAAGSLSVRFDAPEEILES
jgi:hypothetical protein